MGASGGGDQIRKLGDRFQVTPVGHATEPEGVESIPREQAEVGVHVGEQAGGSVVEEVTLVDRFKGEGAIGVGDGA